MYQILQIKNEEQLAPVLEICYRILGEHLREVDNYKFENWKQRIDKDSALLLYAYENNKVLSAVLGRKESFDSLIIGFVACDEENRKKGITQALIEQLEANAKQSGFRYITLGADKNAEGFYEKLGYKIINEMHGQKIYQKLLI